MSLIMLMKSGGVSWAVFESFSVSFPVLLPSSSQPVVLFKSEQIPSACASSLNVVHFLSEVLYVSILESFSEFFKFGVIDIG